MKAKIYYKGEPILFIEADKIEVIKCNDSKTFEVYDVSTQKSELLAMFNFEYSVVMN